MKRTNRFELYLIMVFTFIAILSGCEKITKPIQYVYSNDTNPISIDKNINDIELMQMYQLVKNSPETNRVTVLTQKNVVLIGYQINHYQRFRMHRFEEELQERLKKKFSGKKFIVTNDFKIYLELKRLHQMIDDHKSKQKIEKRFNEIVSLGKEKT